jgi:hypothetical protein
MRHRRSGLLVFSLLLVLVAAVPAGAADTVATRLLRPSQVRSYAGIQAFSAFQDGAYHLAIRRHRRVEMLPVASSQEPFDVDIGPDRNGRPQLIYTRCQVELGDANEGTNHSRGCDLVLLSLAGGGRERPVRGANTQANETRPTLWRGRIAFARQATGRDQPVVYTRALTSPRSRPSRRLPGVPPRARGHRTTGGSIDELDLHANGLAQIVSFVAFGQVSDVRLVDVSDRSSRVLARVGVGEGGQYFVGIGFAGGYLGWAFQWVAGGGELTPGIYRQRLSTGEISRADASPLVEGTLVGLALFAADGAYMIGSSLPAEGCDEVPGDQPDGDLCELVRSQPLRFRPVPPRRRSS